VLDLVSSMLSREIGAEDVSEMTCFVSIVWNLKPELNNSVIMFDLLHLKFVGCLYFTVKNHLAIKVYNYMSL